MSDYRVDAATKAEWAERAMKAESRLALLELTEDCDDPCDEMIPPPKKITPPKR